MAADPTKTDSAARALDSRARQALRHIRRQASLPAGLGETFGEIEHIGGTGAGDCGDGIDQGFVIKPLDASYRRE